MNYDYSYFNQRPQELHPHSSYAHTHTDYPQERYAKRNLTSPVVPRGRVSRGPSRAASREPSRERPRSSHGQHDGVLAYRPRQARRETYPSRPEHTALEDFRKTREWPPRGFRQHSVLSFREAEELIGAGASAFKGYYEEVPHTRTASKRYYAVMSSEHGGRTSRATFHVDAFKDISLTLTGASDEAFPWMSLEQPCMAYAFGKSPGTTTLNNRVAKSGSLQEATRVAAHIKPKKMRLLHILDRLRILETGLDEDDSDAIYDYLYGTLMEDPEKRNNPHSAMELQITDLITVLSNPDWVDFSLPKNQVVAKFFDSAESAKKQQFFHQLLLAVELYLRIYSNEHGEKAKKRLLTQLPPKIAWDLALAQRWLENMSIKRSRNSSHQSTFSFELTSKHRQIDAMRRFASVLKWPNMDELQYILDEKDSHEKAVEDRSADAMSWFTGVVLPGVTLPWLLMNSLIDCDRDTGDALKYLTHMHPASGFQYRANTYWSYQCIVGKVLGAARGVNQVAGWVGPCNFSPDLKRTECVRIRQLPSPEPKLKLVDIDTMALRTDPMGPEDTDYPINEYEVIMPDMEEVTDLIRVEKLNFLPCKDQPGSMVRLGQGAPLTFDSAIIFACGGESWPMRLKYDVDFIQAYPCHQGPHVLFHDYPYHAIKVDDGLVDIRGWGPKAKSHRRADSRSRSRSRRRHSSSSRPPSSHRSSSSSYDRLFREDHKTSIAHGRHSRYDSSSRSRSRSRSRHASTTALEVVDHAPAQNLNTKILAIEALGVSDNEVFARAWCANWGCSAVVANIKETCMACAIREAYAACVGVVILTEGGKKGEGDLGMDI